MYQLGTGVLPFQGQTVHQIFENIRSPSYEIRMPECVDKNLVKVLRGMLNRDPVERFSLNQLRELEWFRKRHPFVKEEFAQWPHDVLVNETGTLRMMQYLEKLCADEDVVSERVKEQLQERIREQSLSGDRESHQKNDASEFNEDETSMPDDEYRHARTRVTPDFNPSVVSMNSNAAQSGLNATTASLRQNASSNTMSNSSANNNNNKTFAQATKVKKNNCVVS